MNEGLRAQDLVYSCPSDNIPMDILDMPDFHSGNKSPVWDHSKESETFLTDDSDSNSLDTKQCSFTIATSSNDPCDSSSSVRARFGIKKESIDELETKFLRKPFLPPCRVCNSPASGLHYGVNTCEACKSFYKRCLRRGGKPEDRCSKGGNCDIDIGNRQSCSECRYMKCTRLGMSKEAVRTGRYTHAMKAQNIMEVKGIPSEKHKDLSLKVCDFNRDCIEKMEETMSILVRTHESIQKTFKLNHFNWKTSDIPIRSQSEDDPDMNAEETYKEKILGLLGKNMDYIIRHLVVFAKAVPGFRNLPLKDQEKLIKAARMSFFILSQYKSYNKDEDTYITSIGLKVILPRLVDSKTRDYHCAALRVVPRVFHLHLNDIEEALIIALSLTYPDFEHPIENNRALDEIQLHLMECLRFVIKKKNLDTEMRVAKIMSCILGFKELTHINEEMYKTSVDYLRLLLYESPLLMEMLNLNVKD